jgi:glycosyltransferase involved in cell wall biosynthesis
VEVLDVSSPKVSVVIPAYRASRTIGRAIDSVLAQTRPASEIIVVDDGSPDDTGAAVAPYGEQVRLLRKANGGAASARNLGIDQSAGDLIAFLDADDYWEPHKLEKQLGVLTEHPEVGAVAGGFYEQLPGSERTVKRFGEPVLFDHVWDRPPGPTAFEIGRRFFTSAVLVRRVSLGERRFDEGLSTAEDMDLWVRLATSSPTYLVSEPLTTAVLESGSLSRSDPDADSRNMLEVVRRHASLLGPAGVSMWEARVYSDWAAQHLGAGCPGAALRPAWNHLTRRPFSLRAWWIVCKSAVTATGRKMLGLGTTGATNTAPSV